MEVKKSPKADLEGKKSLFLEIGLCVSLLLMIGAFAWGQGKREAPSLPEAVEEFVQTEEIENTVQDQPVPQIPTPANVMSAITDNIQIVDNNTQIETTQVFAEFDFDTGFSNAATTEQIGTGDEEWPEFFTKVEIMPTYKGGDINAFSRQLQRRVEYPETAMNMGLSGEVVVQFMVNPDGKVTDIKIISDTPKPLNDEVLRKMRSMTTGWVAGRNANTPVKVRVDVPIMFNLN